MAKVFDCFVIQLSVDTEIYKAKLLLQNVKYYEILITHTQT